MNNKRTPNQGYVYFGLFGEFEPDEITEKIGITPTSACAQGARNPDRQLPRTSQWQLSSEKIVAEFVDVYQLSEVVVNQLLPFESNIKETIVEFSLNAVLEVVLHFSTDDEVSTPAIGFSSEVLRFLAEVGASIDIDTYILSAD